MSRLRLGVLSFLFCLLSIVVSKAQEKGRLALVEQPLLLANAIFEKDFVLTHSILHQKVDFSITQFRSNVKLEANEFLDKVDFSNASFERTFSLSTSKFKENVCFEESKFNGQQNVFANLLFYEEANFYGAKFKNTVIFKDVNFYGACNFEHISLPDTLILDNLQSDSTELSIDITRPLKSSLPCKLYLHNVDFDKLIINYEYFDLCFDDKKTNPKPLSLQQKTVMYQSLIHQQRTYGFYKGKAKAEQDYEDFKEMNRIIQMNRDSKTFGIIGIVFLLVVLLYLTIRRNNKTKVIQLTPPVSPTPYQSPTLEDLGANYRPVSIPLDQVSHLVTKGQQKWDSYHIPVDVLNDSEMFWRSYEELLTQAKGIKGDA